MKVKNSYVLTEVGSDIIAVPVGDSEEASQQVVHMNQTAADIWRGIEQEKSLEEIAADLVDKYDGVDPESALGYIKKVVKQFTDAGIITE